MAFGSVAKQAPLGERAVTAALHLTRPRTLLWLATTAFAGGFAALALMQHRAFSTGRFDVGNLTQAVWSTAHGRLLEMTDLHGRQFNRLGAHFDPIVAALAPLWWLWPDPSVLLVVQSAAVALGAPAVFLLARKHLGSEWAGLGAALIYLLYPATQWLVLDDFHPVAFATPLLLWAIWFLDEDRLLAFALVAGVACTTKEQLGLLIAALGAWYAVARGRRGAGILVAVAGVGAACFALAVVDRYAPGGGSPFASRYEAVGDTPGGIAQTAIAHPLLVLEEAFSGRDLSYLGDLLLPLAALPLLAPLLALTALPELALNLLSSARTQTSIHFHYTAAAIPGLVTATVLGAARIRKRWPSHFPAVARLAVVVVLVSGVVLGPLPLWRHVPFGATLATADHLADAHDAAAMHALATIPRDAPVSATNTLGAHLSERRRIFSFPTLAEATWVAVDTTRPSYLDRAVAPRAFADALRRLEMDRRWHLVVSEDGVLVFRRDEARAQDE